MKIRILENVLVGGIWYEPSIHFIDTSDAIGEHLVRIGCAEKLETKIVEVAEKKSPPATSSVSQPAPVSPETTAKPRRGRKPKSL